MERAPLCLIMGKHVSLSAGTLDQKPFVMRLWLILRTQCHLWSEMSGCIFIYYLTISVAKVCTEISGNLIFQLSHQGVCYQFVIRCIIKMSNSWAITPNPNPNTIHYFNSIPWFYQPMPLHHPTLVPKHFCRKNDLKDFSHDREQLSSLNPV